MGEELRRSGLLDEGGAARFCRYGHFAYESGDHGDTWLALELLFVDPRRLQGAAARLAGKVRGYAPDVVCGPLLGGALVGQWVAHALDAAFVFAEASPATTVAARGYAVPAALRPALRGKRVVVVDDVINAGSATLACIRDVEAQGGSVVAVASLLVRERVGGGASGSVGVPVEYLVGMRWNVWPANGCPLCRSGVPIEAVPGAASTSE